MSSLPYGPTLPYTCNLAKLPPELRECFLELSADDATYDFLRNHDGSHLGTWASIKAKTLSPFLSHYDVTGITGTSKMFLLSHEHWKKLLLPPPQPEGSPESDSPSLGKLLDVGAGDGGVTAHLAGLFRAVEATETSRVLAWALARKGYRVWDSDIAEKGVPPSKPFDVISVLNVLDRCSRPLDIIRAVGAGLARPHGRAIFAVVLPFCP
eukprot:RCo038906